MKELRSLSKLIGLLVLAAAGGLALLLTSCSRDQDSAAGAKEEQLYTCGMHPQVIEHKPGNCPICGMKLTPVRKQAGPKAPTAEHKVKYYKSTMNPGEVSPGPAKDSMGMDMVPVYEDEASAAESSAITIDPVTMQNMNLRTGVVTRGPLGADVATVSGVVSVPAHEVEHVVDQNGAGDMFASGFLYGLALGADPVEAAELGSLCAGEIIAHLGARPESDLEELAIEAGLL